MVTPVLRDRLFRASIRQVLGDDANVQWDPEVDERPSDALPETVQVLNIQSSMIDENLFQQHRSKNLVDNAMETEDSVTSFFHNNNKKSSDRNRKRSSPISPQPSYSAAKVTKKSYANQTVAPTLSEKTSLMPDNLRLHQTYGPDQIRQTFATFPVHDARKLHSQRQSTLPHSQTVEQRLEQTVSVLCEKIDQILTSVKEGAYTRSMSDSDVSSDLRHVHDHKTRQNIVFIILLHRNIMRKIRDHRKTLVLPIKKDGSNCLGGGGTGGDLLHPQVVLMTQIVLLIDIVIRLGIEENANIATENHIQVRVRVPPLVQIQVLVAHAMILIL